MGVDYIFIMCMDGLFIQCLKSLAFISFLDEYQRMDRQL
ncbi:hypothetical protein PULV_a1251 [Pseudoalteromonas ulvae UL12]|nr:hypothetical protein [Pseudoalteromonas ulvae UL12]